MKNKERIAVITAMQKELDTIISHFPNCQEVLIGPRRFFQATIGQIEVLLGVAGIGKVNAAITTSIICEVFKPTLIINCGVAGGVDKSLHPLDVVIASQVAYHDVECGFLEDAIHFGQISGEPAYFPCDTRVVSLLKQQRNLPFNYQVGTIITGDQFITNRKYIDEVLEKGFTDCHVSACDMESASIGHVAYQYQIPVMIVRSISDVVGADQEENYPNFVITAASNASYIVNLLINNQ